MVAQEGTWAHPSVDSPRRLPRSEPFVVLAHRLSGSFSSIWVNTRYLNMTPGRCQLSTNRELAHLSSIQRVKLVLGPEMREEGPRVRMQSVCQDLQPSTCHYVTFAVGYPGHRCAVAVQGHVRNKSTVPRCLVTAEEGT